MPKPTTQRITPNPQSTLLKKAVIAGAGLGVPPGSDPPAGMGVLVLYVPLTHLTTMAPRSIQADMGLPWAVDGGGSAWFDEVEAVDKSRGQRGEQR